MKQKTRFKNFEKVGQPKSMKSNFFLAFQKLMKCPQTKFHADTMSYSKVIS